MTQSQNSTALEKALKVNLVVERGRTSVSKITLRKLPTTVGRHRSCRLQITSRQVSREHCVFDEQDGVLIVKDLGSSNGTYVNGQRITLETVLEPGDKIEIGPVLFRVDYDVVEMNTVAADSPEDSLDSSEELETNTIVGEEDSGQLYTTERVEIEPEVKQKTLPEFDPFEAAEGPATEEGFTLFEENQAESGTLFEAPEEQFGTIAEMFDVQDSDSEADSPATFFEADHDRHSTLFENTDDDK